MPVFKSATPAARSTLICFVAALASGCASDPITYSGPCNDASYSLSDPAEPVNRGIFAFNRTLDDYALAPIARGYLHLPAFFQTGVHNFVANFGEPKVFINDLLQGNGERSVTTFGRFVINSTVGVLGLIDVSGNMGIERHKSDFGQTFGVWNLASGPIIELPLFGTSNLRDAAGKVVSFAVDPLGSNSDTVSTLGAINTVGGTIDSRADVLPLTDKLRKQPDYYSSLRDTVAQRRANFVVEGKSGVIAHTEFKCQNDVPNDELQ